MKTAPPLTGRTTCAAVLLEVVLALVLFVAAATIIGASLNSAMHGVERQKLNAHAVNLTVSVVSELQMGTRTVEILGPAPFESPFEHWTWQLVLTPIESEVGEYSDLTGVEVIVRHDSPQMVHRLTQMLKLDRGTSLPKKETAYFQP